MLQRAALFRRVVPGSISLLTRECEQLWWSRVSSSCWWAVMFPQASNGLLCKPGGSSQKPSVPAHSLAAAVCSPVSAVSHDIITCPRCHRVGSFPRYHFSMDDRCKSLMAYHRDSISVVRGSDLATWASFALGGWHDYAASTRRSLPRATSWQGHIRLHCASCWSLMFPLVQPEHCASEREGLGGFDGEFGCACTRCGGLLQPPWSLLLALFVPTLSLSRSSYKAAYSQPLCSAC